MASGDSLIQFNSYRNQPPSGSWAIPDLRNMHPVLDFSSTTSKYAVFGDALPQAYSGCGINIFVHTSFTTASAGSALLQFNFERIGNEILDTDDDNWGPNSSLIIDVPPTAGYVNITSINIADGASMANIAAGELFRIRVWRDCNHASDTADDDLELHNIELRELA